MSTSYNPMAVMMGSPGKTGIPYIGGSPPTAGQKTGTVPAIPPSNQGPPSAGQKTGTMPPPSNVLGPSSVRATGTGPFDSAYRQDLATFAGGLFDRPGGNLSFNPTSNTPFGGAATGGGNAPVLGMPNTLLQNALGGNPFTYTPPTPAASTPSGDSTSQSMQQWLQQFMDQGGKQRLS